MIVETLKCNCEYDGDNIEYIYNLIKRDLHVDNDGSKCCIKAYGIEIESKVMNQDKIVQTSTEEIEYITPYKYKGSQLLHKLKKNMVSPVHLIDITEDLIEEYYKDFDKELYNEVYKITV